jgi:hypothetical protein
MAVQHRSTLKNYFLKRNIPKEGHFHDLIDSMINQKDDGLEKNQNEALKIKAEGKNEELLNFYKNIDDLNSTWQIRQVSDDGNEGIEFYETGNGSAMFIEKGGNVGVGKTQPNCKLDVDGFVGMKGRVGYYKHGEIPANGKWHDVLIELNDYNAFEIIAVTGRKGAHSMTHAFALSTYGKSKNKIKKVQAYYGRCRNKIDMRWTGEYFNYQLQIKTKRNLGEGVFITYHVTKLF